MPKMNPSTFHALTLEDFRLAPANAPMQHRAERLVYEGYHVRQHGECGLDIYTDGSRLVFIVTEIPGNPGPSITNCVENVAYQIGQKFANNGSVAFSQSKDYIIIEHYHKDSVLDEHFDLVRCLMCRNGRPSDVRWYRLEPSEIARLIGQEMELEF